MIQFVKRNCVQLLYPGEFNLLMTTMSIFEMLLDDAVADSPDDYDKFLITWFQAAMIYSVVWGIGGLLNANSRDQFDTMHRSVSFADSVVVVTGKLLYSVYLSIQFLDMGIHK